MLLDSLHLIAAPYTASKYVQVSRNHINMIVH